MFGQPAHDPRPNEELWGRYYCELVQDEEALAGASESEVGDMFDTWTKQNRRQATTTTNLFPKPSARFLFCLMLDKESVEHLLDLPKDPAA